MPKTRVGKPNSQGSSRISTNTLFVGNLPTTFSQNKLVKLFSDVGPIRRSFLVRNKGVGYVTYAMGEDAEIALKSGVVCEGRRLNLKFATRRVSVQERKMTVKDKSDEYSEVQEKQKVKIKRERKPNLKKGKLIIRNISWKVDETALKNEFSKFGDIVEVLIPKKADGNSRGFCFVQFAKKLCAQKAIHAMNGEIWCGRPIAIDFSLPKKTYLELKHQDEKESDHESDSNEEVEDETKQVTSTKSQEKTEKNKKEIKNEVIATRPSDGGFFKDDEVCDFIDDESQKSDEDGENDKDEVDHSESENEDDDDNEDSESEDEDEDGNEYNDNDDDDNDGNFEDANNIETKNLKNRHVKTPDSDISDGRTLFIRNLTFSTTKEKLKEAFSTYGLLHYALVCLDPLTEYSKGTAFVKYHDKVDADTCLAKSKEKDGIVLDGNKLTVSIAISKQDLIKKAEEKVKKPKDNRNLYLAREGLIRPGTEAAKDVSAKDLQKRIRVELWKNSRLKNLNIFVSPYRLCVRNIPPSVGDTRLRKIFIDAGGEGADVIEARIMRDVKQFGANKNALSKGFGFVRFTTHEHALKALRYTNNNPNIFTINQRPIVEFSLENKEALNVKQKRLERSIQNNKKNKEAQHLQQEERLHQKQVQRMARGKRKSTVVGGKLSLHASELTGIVDPESIPFAGVQTNPIEKKKGLPSHIGPKIRHTGRKTTSKMSRQKMLRVKKRELLQKQNGEKKSPAIRIKHPTKKKAVDHHEVHLEKLVSQHKRKMLDQRPARPTKRKKWFN